MTLRRVVVILLFAEVFVHALRPPVDPDLGWHLRTGELIWQHGIPRHDVFSFTAGDRVWIVHEWLTEAAMWAIYRVGGLEGLSVLFAVLTTLGFWLIYRCSSGRPYLAGGIMALAGFIVLPCAGVRPQVLNLLLAAVMVSLLERYRDGQLSHRSLFLLPLLIALWANLHSGYLMGIALLAVYTLGSALDILSDRSSGRTLTWSDVRLLALLAVGSLVAGLVNPNGWRQTGFSIGTLTNPMIQKYIQEWASPDFHTPIAWAFAGMMALGVIGFVLAPARPSWSGVLLFLTTAAAGLWSQRHIPLFALLNVPLLSRMLEGVLAQTKFARFMSAQADTPTARLARLHRWLLATGLITAAIWGGHKLFTNEAEIAKVAPVAAVDFLEQQHLAATRGYNTYGWGGYLIWRGVPVFVDGRAELYGDFLEYYFKTLYMSEYWRTPLDAFDVSYVLLEKSNPLGTLLTTSGEWREAYADDLARVFVRNATPGVGPKS